MPLRHQENTLLLASLLLALALSAIEPFDRFTWFLETLPVMLALPLLVATRQRFPLTPLAYRLIWLFALVLIWGGHHTYAENPLFDWLQDEFDLARNYYDRLGHVMQGVTPAILAREILLRRSPLRPGKWLFFITCCVTLAISASYEFIEWWVALLSGEEAVAFLATQGDPWDTQWDMFLALCGAVGVQLLCNPAHDRQLAQLGFRPKPCALPTTP